MKRRIGDLGWRRRNGEIGSRGQEVGSEKVL